MIGQFSVRGFNLCESLARHSPEQLCRFLQRMKTLDMNSVVLHYDYGFARYQDLLLEETKRNNIEIDLMIFGPRTFFRAVDWKKEWFAVDENGKPFSEEPECETYPCGANQEAVEAFEEGAKLVLSSLPSQIRRVNMRAPDGLCSCRCPKCRGLHLPEKFQVFIQAFIRAGRSVRPDLKLESDLYIGRYRLPEDPSASLQLDRLMYDTFYRLPQLPIGHVTPWNSATFYASGGEITDDSVSPNVYHKQCLADWCRLMPRRIFIHENAMLQSYHGIFQHNTGIMLQDQQLYREMGAAGVLYEAYEPGYESYAKHFEVLARGLKDPSILADYQPGALEKKICVPKPELAYFCSDPAFPIEQYLPDEFTRKHVDFHRRLSFSPNVKYFQDYISFALEHKDRLDYIYIAWHCAKSGLRQKVLSFDRASEETKHMLSHTKLWDWMEKIPASADPLLESERRIEDMLRSVQCPS